MRKKRFFESILESKKVSKQTKWMRWDVEWPRIALCDGQFENFDQKIQRKSTLLGLGPKKTIFCHNYLTRKHLK